MKKRRLIIVFLIILVMLVVYLQFGRDVKIVSSHNSSAGNYYEMSFTVVANRLVITDKEQFAEEMIERGIRNDFHEIRFSYDLVGYPNRLVIYVYLNDFERNNYGESFVIRYEADHNLEVPYNIKDHPDRFHLTINNQ